MTVSSETLRSIATPERLDTRLGTLEFVDGVPTGETAKLVYDHLDFVHARQRLSRRVRGGVDVRDPEGLPRGGRRRQPDHHLLGADGVGVGVLDRERRHGLFPRHRRSDVGPDGRRDAAAALGVIDDMWWGWIVDFGLPGPDRGEGGRFLLVPPGYDGPLPDSGYHVGHSRTSLALMAGRSFLTDDDPAPTVERIKSTLKIYPYDARRLRHERRDAARGRPWACHSRRQQVPETVFVEGSGKAFNTVPPSDFGFFELMNEVVQEEPAGSTNAELMGQLAAIGIVKGEPFAPDERMRRILEDAAAVGAATSRALFFDSRASEEFAYYDGSAWFNMLWVGGYTFETPPPLVTADGIEP